MSDSLQVDVPHNEDSLRSVEMVEEAPKPSESSLKTSSYSNEELLLAEDEDYQETDDESDDNELDIFLSLMNKAEKKNEKRIQKKKNQFGTTKIDWSNVRLDE